jgi:hypothetical protein
VQKWLLLAAVVILPLTAEPVPNEPGRDTPTPVSSQTPGTVLLRLSFIDGSTRLPTAVRVGVFDSSGTAIPPTPPEEYLFQDLVKRSYFYADGVVELYVPEGPVTIRALKGFEYEPVLIEKTIRIDTYLSLRMRRWIDMPSLGWFSGETHTHMTHAPQVYVLTPEDLTRVMEAEDLNFLNSMDREVHFTGGPHPLSSPQRMLYFSREYRNPHFSHISLLGLSEWVSTEEACWDTSGVACGKMLHSVVAADVHAQPGAILIMTHPFPTTDYFDVSPWPGGGVARGIPLDLVDGNIDAIDILCYTHIPPPEGLEEYTQALNAGFRIPASAGTDRSLAGGSAPPTGGYRVYAKVGDGPEDFNSQTWIDAVKLGRSFVTNFPIIEMFEIEGHEIGSTVSTHDPVVTGYVSAVCAAPMERVEIVAEGEVVDVIPPPPGGDGLHISGSFQVRADSVRWVIARVTGTAAPWYVVSASGLFAQTNPIYINYLDTPALYIYPKQQQAADYFIERLSQLTLLYNSKGYFPNDSRPAFDDAVDRALLYYLGVVLEPPSGFSLLDPTSWSYTHDSVVAPTTTPTFVWETAIDRDPGGYVVYDLLYGPDSTFSTGAFSVTVPDTFYTVSAGSALTNLEQYYWKVVAVDETGFRTDGTPPLSSFLVDETASALRDPALPSTWRLDPAAPNPFNPRIRVGYTVPVGAGPHSVDVVDVRGTVVRTLYSGPRPAGRYTLSWDGVNGRGNRVASGVYFFRLLSADSGLIATQKVILLK